MRQQSRLAAAVEPPREILPVDVYPSVPEALLVAAQWVDLGIQEVRDAGPAHAQLKRAWFLVL
jgi:hypothetical protein